MGSTKDCADLQDCSVDACPSYEHCFENKDGNGQVKSKVCLKKCQNSSECREPKYHCTPAGNVCLPK